MRKGILRITPLLILLVGLSVLSDAGPKYKYKGRGEALILNNDIPSAKKNALMDALRNAVQKAVGIYIKSHSKVENFKMTYEKILSDSEGYVKAYKITSEKEEDGMYIVEVKANVLKEKLDDAFSQRISKFIEKNLFSSISIALTVGESNNRLTNFYLYLYGNINDPTLDINSVTIKFPNSGWIKPKILKYGMANQLSLQEQANSFTKTITPKYLKDMIDLLESRDKSILVRFKNPGNNKIEIRKKHLDICTINISTTEDPLLISIIQKQLKNISRKDIATIIRNLKKFSGILSREKNLFGMTGRISFSLSKGSFQTKFSCTTPVKKMNLNSIYIKMPKSGWIKPEIMDQKMVATLTVASRVKKFNKLKYLADVIYLLERGISTIDVKFKYKDSSKIINQKILFGDLTAYVKKDRKTIISLSSKKLKGMSRSETKRIANSVKNLKYQD